MKIPPQQFFNFCATHVSLVRALAEKPGELSEADIRRTIRTHAEVDGEQAETTWRRLRELQILVETERASDFYLVADPIRRLVAYLFDEARATTPESIRGFIQSLDTSAKHLVRAVESEDPITLRLELEQVQQTLGRIQAELDETHRAVLNEVSRYKTERQGVSVRAKFQRMAHWMSRFVNPMVEIVRPGGPMQEAFDQIEALLRQAREHGLFNDLPALERNARLLRQLPRHALHIFGQCRNEMLPLYESLRRASFIAEGAALALEALQRHGRDGWAEQHGVAVRQLRWQNVPTDAAIERAFRNLIDHPPEPPPVLMLESEHPEPPEYLRHCWLESLPDEVSPALPLSDLLGWLVERYPERDTADTLAGFTQLVFNPEFSAQFTGGEADDYPTADGALTAAPVQLSRP